jgi:GrpB protein
LAKGGLVRSRSIVGVLALILAVAAISAGTAFAQTPVVPATTIAPLPDDKSKVDPKDGREKPKAEKPKAEKPKPEKPKPEKPKPEKPKPEKPKPEKPKLEKPKPEKPKPEKPKPEKPEPAQSTPTPEKPRPAQPKLETPKPTRSKPAQPRRAQAGAPRAKPDKPGPEPQLEVARTVSPRPNAARSGAGAASPERSGTNSARGGSDSADATLVAGGPAAVIPRRAPRPANDVVATTAADLVDRQRAGVLPLDAPAGYNVTLLLLTLLFAIVYPVGLRYLSRRETRSGLGSAAWRGLRIAALRPRFPARASRRRSNVHVFQPDGPLLDANRLVRDYLRAHLDIAREYAMTKEKALARGVTDLRSYSHAKGAHLASIRKAAYHWARRFRTR